MYVDGVSDIQALKPSIGTRVFVVVPTKGVVVPAVVVEKVTRETQQGTSTSYLLNFGEEGRERVPSDAIDGSVVVDSATAAYETIVDLAHRKADSAVQAAVKKSVDRFGPMSASEQMNSESSGEISMEELAAWSSSGIQQESDIDIGVNSLNTGVTPVDTGVQQET